MNEENKKLSLNESIIKIRVELQNSNLKKSGKNKFAGFEYFELADFLPRLNELMLEHGINDLFSINDNIASLTLIKDDETQKYEIPFIMFDTPVNKNGVPSMQDIQYLGALNTYYKRYLYLNAFGITDGEIIDSMDNNNEENNIPKITEKQKEMIKKLYSKEDIKLELITLKKSKISDLTIKEASDLISKKKEVE